jgi:F-type H+-transporting ATPase subunit b
VTAWAAEAGAHGAEPFYTGGEFWVAVGFVLFVLLVGRTAYRVIAVALDDRSERIRNQIDEANRLAAEAQELLASSESKRREAAGEAEEIIARARNQADALAKHAADELEQALKRREHLATERIAQAEAAAIAEVRGRAVEIAFAATDRLLREQVKGKKASALIDAAIKDLPDKLRAH